MDPDRQLPSEGVCRGGVRVPPSGEPVLFLADHPVTGGYPVVAVVVDAVVDADVDLAAQVRPGQSLRLSWVPAPFTAEDPADSEDPDDPAHPHEEEAARR